MTKKILAAIGAVVVLAACGGSGDANASKIADKLMSEADKQGMKVEKTCVAELAGKFSDADQELLVANIDNEDFDIEQLSADGQTTAMGLMSCVDKDQLIDSMMEQVGDVPGLDKECLRKVFADIDPEQLAAIAQNGGSDTVDLQTEVLACLSAG